MRDQLCVYRPLFWVRGTARVDCRQCLPRPPGQRALIVLGERIAHDRVYQAMRAHEASIGGNLVPLLPQVLNEALVLQGRQRVLPNHRTDFPRRVCDLVEQSERNPEELKKVLSFNSMSASDRVRSRRFVANVHALLTDAG